MRNSIGVLLFLLCFVSRTVMGQETLPVSGFGPETYRAGNQNWMLSQDDSRHIYIANNSGLLEYNGAQWHLNQTGDGGVVRSVMVSENRIYTGAYMEFGYWERQDDGRLEYTSLIPLVNGGIRYGEQFWHIEVLGNYILFQSPNNIYSYHKEDQSITVISSENIILNLFRVGNNAYYQAINEGLYVIENGKPSTVVPYEAIRNEMIVGLFPYNDGMLAVTRGSGVFAAGDGKWEALPVEGYPYSESIYVALLLNDNTLALGSIGNGLYLLGPGNGQEQHYLQPTLTNNTVLSLFEDASGDIWCGTDNGISVINRQNTIKLFNDTFGKTGTVYCSYQENGLRYLGTNQGLYISDTGQETPYRLVPGTKGQVWTITRIGRTLYAGHDRGTFIIDKDRAELIFDQSGTWELKPLGKGIIQGHYDGITHIDSTGAIRKIKGFDLSSRNIVVENDSTVWIAHDHNGVFRLKMNPDATVKKVRSFSPSANTPQGVSVFKFGDSIYYSTREHIYKFLSEADSFTPENRLEQLTADTRRITGTSTVTPDGVWWTFGEDGIYHTATDAFRNRPELRYVPLPAAYRSIATRFENISLLSRDKYLVGSSMGYVVFELPYQYNAPRKLSIQAVETADRREHYTPRSLNNRDTELPSRINFIRFEYSVLQYSRLNDVKYSYRIANYTPAWSAWSPEATAGFKNIPPGEYLFEVRARINGQVTGTENFRFTIAPPWYASRTAAVVYVLLLLALIVFVHRMYSDYYRRQQQRLITRQQKELEIKQLESRQEIMTLENQKLENDMASKNRELAASTMSIIRKNELLAELKDKLSRAGTPEDTRKVISFINRNMDDEDNWNLFKEAFNNADKDFLHAVKQKHPNLTPNDLKLCAYLRLNLSSKEIAPLLNISVRSVEIKRYRLRKKMELDHKDGLAEYILNFRASTNS
ncbi:helix-turn-helix and ligand-binding sensor domain-containing protein [Sinomicrobium soli]|uniref:helix-turn-helix and ligand-binding sensor domain-containing protein n=1 Tax=Sinomicrobium sp. N-1-3-6 TaxID=2219864 RepID=UPI001374CF3D|nr:two-component regulator propeller domain-containing protein [Sinomicrobium sp. N-1-3-6]